MRRLEPRRTELFEKKKRKNILLRKEIPKGIFSRPHIQEIITL